MTDVGQASAVEGAEVVFRLPDPEHALAGVHLWQDLGIADDKLDFDRVGDGWELRLARPSVHRLEYLFEVRDGAGAVSSRLDPTNPLVVGGAFGAHSWLKLPGYVAPDWVDIEPVESTLDDLTVPATPVGDVDVQVWSPADAAPDEALPLLLSHDGPEFMTYAGLTHYVGAMVARDALPRLRLALLRPGVRNSWYSANDGYATTLVGHVLPAVTHDYSAEGDPVLMGASLGALAAMHAEWTHPGTFAGLFLQSGSFFTMETDPQEADFSHFADVTAFVREVLGTADPPSRPRVAMTSGSVEENVHNNRVMAAHLGDLGYAVEYGETPDVHNFTAWRDVLDPYLTALLLQVWGDGRAA